MRAEAFHRLDAAAVELHREHAGKSGRCRRRRAPCRRRTRRARSRHGCRSAPALWRRKSASSRRGSTARSQATPLTVSLIGRGALMRPSPCARRHAAASARLGEHADEMATIVGRGVQVGRRLDAGAHRVDGRVDRAGVERLADQQRLGLGGALRRLADAGHGDASFVDHATARRSASPRPRRARSRRRGARPPRSPSRWPAASFGSAISVTMSSAARSTVSAPRKKSRAATMRRPEADVISSSASSSSAIIGSSAAGSACDEAAADGAAVADREMRDMRHRAGEHRQMPRDHRRGLELVMTRRARRS